MKRICVLFSILLSVPLLVASAGPPAQARAQAQAQVQAAVDPVFVCDGTYRHRTFKSVVVKDGDKCRIFGSVIRRNLRTTGSPRLIKIINTPIRRNTEIRNVTERVVIGNRGCRIDPRNGNNLLVRDSRNVAICQMSVDNNLAVKHNTGRVTVIDNIACNSLRVVNNDLIALRVKDNRYVNEFSTADNTVTNTRVVKRNRQLNGTSADCRERVG